MPVLNFFLNTIQISPNSNELSFAKLKSITATFYAAPMFTKGSTNNSNKFKEAIEWTGFKINNNIKSNPNKLKIQNLLR